MQVVSATDIPTAAVEGTDNLSFTPANVTVKVGQRVRWTDSGTTPHNVTFESGPTSSTMNPGDEFEVKFTKAGTYHYVCTFHAPGMVGTVTVER